MSYILDALRRAEAERERGSVPGLHAQAVGAVAGMPARGAPRTGAWALPAIVVLGIAVALLGWRPWAAETAVAPVSRDAPVAPSPAPAAVQAPAPAPVERLVLPPAIEAPTKTTAVLAKKRAAAPAASAANPAAAASVATAAPAKLMTQAELPDDVRRELPPVTIGGSSYSANPASRFVIVNGLLFHEGDTLAPGVLLEQIRLKSAVLSFKGYRYSVSF